MANDLPNVTVFSLGGTIASMPRNVAAEGANRADDGADGGGVAPTIEAAELVAAVPEMGEVAHVDTVSFRQVASGELTLDDIVDLASAIRARFAAGATGVVVTQGTDTIEETAFALDLLLAGTRPVVITGAMRNPSLPGADGPANLLAAVRVAASADAAGLGCLVVMNDEIHAARFVRKTHTSSPAAFRSISTGALGWVLEGRPHIVVRPDSLVGTPASAEAIPAVALVKICLGDDARLLEQIPRLGYSGLIVEALGGGHVPSALAPALGRLAEAMPVVLASRTGAGELLRYTYSYPGSERDLLARHLIPAGYLDGAKARILLALLLASGAGVEDIRAAFDRFAG